MDYISTGELIGTAIAALLAGLAHRVGKKNEKTLQVNGGDVALGKAIHDFQEYQRFRNHAQANALARIEALIRLYMHDMTHDDKWLLMDGQELAMLLRPDPLPPDES